MSSVSALILCVPPLRGLVATLDALDRQTLAASEVVLIEPPGLSEREAQLMAAAADRPGVRRVKAADPSPGAARNAGVKESRGEQVVFLDPGDVCAPGWLEALERALVEDESILWVTDRPERGWGTPGPVELGALQGTHAVLGGPLLFRRRTWQAAGGFDETLTAHEEYELWLRAMSQGGEGRILERNLVATPLDKRGRRRRQCEDPVAQRALEEIAFRHRAAYARDAASVLEEKERVLRGVTARHAELMARQAALKAELEKVDAEAQALEAELSRQGRQGLEWADLRRTSPLSAFWGYERGKPVDRVYIERFLEENAADIRGAVLEVQESDFTRRFGGECVTRSEVVDLDPDNEKATLIADLRRATNLPEGTFDCFILTQTLHVIDDWRAAVAQALRVLKPGGVLLATIPCASRVCLEYGADGDLWRATEGGARALFQGLVQPDGLAVTGYGNGLVTSAFLAGLGSHEVSAEEYEAYDPFHPTLIGVRAVKAAKRSRRSSAAAAILAYHRVADASSDVHGLCVWPEIFAEQLDQLRRSFQPISLSDLVEGAAQGRLPERAVAITFDDGYLDNLHTASPLLSAAGVPATFFACGPEQERPGEWWWDVLERALLEEGPRPEVWASGGEALPTTRRAERLAAHQKLYLQLLRMDGAQRDAMARQLARWAQLKPDPRRRRMTAAELRSLADRPGQTLGAHSRDHLFLPAHPAAVVAEQLTENRTGLAQLLEAKVDVLAYPYGAFSPEVVEAARDAGFRAAVTCEERPVVPGEDLLRLPRLDPKRRSGPHFAQWLERELSRVERRAVAP